MTQINSTKCSLTRDPINLIFIVSRLNVGVAGLTDFSLVTKMSMISKNRRFIGLSFNVFIKSKRTIRMDLKSFMLNALLGLHFRINLQVFMFLRLFFYLYFVRSSVAWFWRFKNYRLLINLGLDSSTGLLCWLVYLHLCIVFAWGKSGANVHFVLFL